MDTSTTTLYVATEIIILHFIVGFGYLLYKTKKERKIIIFRSFYFSKIIVIKLKTQILKRFVKLYFLACLRRKYHFDPDGILQLMLRRHHF
ncbi:hypothetical protein ES044_03965 [Polaribacter sp. IC066]|nr:hypothetical protein ES043_07005 [Polaribacter sp. IC063]TXD61654.1 hypothetical protein ES044_03965 [Polaribacter sp. IC066]